MVKNIFGVRSTQFESLFCSFPRFYSLSSLDPHELQLPLYSNEKGWDVEERGPLGTLDGNGS